jgi:2,5-dihydroxypyridine 5,6-dioxygenase
MVDIFKGASRLVRECGDVAKDEKVLIVTDTHSIKYGQVTMAAVAEITDQVAMVVLKTHGRLHGQNPPEPVSAAMKSSNVVFMITEWSLAHCQARHDASKSGARMLSTAQPDDELFARTIPESPFAEMKPVVQKVNELLSEANEAHVTTKLGTDLWIDLRGVKNIDLEHGYCLRKPEYAANFAGPPVIESNIAPVEYRTHGTLVVDACQAALGILHQPITLRIEKGKVVKFEGGNEARQLEEILARVGDPGIYFVAELGIGLSPIAKLRGRFYEDESIYGTAHIGLGNNASTMGGNLKVNGHMDHIFWRPTINLDGKAMMEEGRLVYPGAPNIVGCYIK